MRIAFLLPGIHNVNRGAEVAFESIASHIARAGRDDVTVFGSGPDRAGQPYVYRRSSLVPRERFERAPSFPPFRSNYVYEELTWTASALCTYRPSDFDVTVTCSFPFVHWLASRWPSRKSKRPKHIFVTQNGDHPALSDRLEYRSFRCDGLVCTNPLYFERERERWRSVLIPNGIEPDRFSPGPSRRASFGIPDEVPVVLIVSALVDTKRVIEGLSAVAQIPDAYLVVAGDGPLRAQFDAVGERLMPGRFRRLTVPAQEMPDLYRSADVLLHPALLESFGNIYIEATAVGLPVVAHDSVVTRWIFGSDASLVDTTDPDQVIDAVTAALQQDSNAAAERARKTHARFAWSTIATQYRDFASDVVGGARGDHS
jgi:glycosyltransferase involved in cell wall biosynthesis